MNQNACVRIMILSAVVFGSGLLAKPASASPGEASDYIPEEQGKDETYVGCGHMTKGICQTATLRGWGPNVLNQGASNQEALKSCKFPAAKPGKWAKLSLWARKQMGSDLERGDVAFIPASSEWEAATCGDEKCRCVSVSWYRKKVEFETNACGSYDRNSACERAGGLTPSNTTRAINMIHFRLDKAKKASEEGDTDACSSAAASAVAMSRGLPKFKKQEVKYGRWENGVSYITRYDGNLKEAELFAKVAKFGVEAQALLKKCGGSELSDDKAERAFEKPRSML
jgi:hypothetical protein